MRAQRLAALVLMLPCLAASAGPPALAPLRIATVAPSGSGPIYEVVLDSAADGTVAMAWKVGYDEWIRVAVSTDGGLRFGPVLPIAVGDSPSLTIGAGGVIDVTWWEWRTGPPEEQLVHHRRSLDGGLSFGSAHRVLSDARRGELLASPGGKLAVLEAWSPGRLSTSGDGGSTWSPPASLVVRGAPAGLWLDDSRFLACAAEQSDVRCQLSSDGGLSFAAPEMALSAPGEHFHAVDVERLGSGQLALAISGQTGTRVSLSADDGASWGAAQLVDPGPDYASIDSAPASAAWLTTGGGYYRSDDGRTWTLVAGPDAVLGCRAHQQLPLRSLGGDDVRLGYFVGWRSDDGGASWQGPAEPASYRDAVRGARLLRGANGRLLALWLEGSGSVAAIRSSASDDGGVTWTSPIQVNDRAHLSPLGGLLDGDPELWSALALREGGFVIVWPAVAATGCLELRASTSADGAGWSPSVVVGVGEGVLQLRLAEAASGILVTLLHVGSPGASAMRLSRSGDGGNSWSAPAPVSLLAGIFDDVWAESELVGWPDGSLTLIALGNEVFQTSRLAAVRSLDAGDTWVESSYAFDVIGNYIGTQLVAAGSRLVAQMWSAYLWYTATAGFESWDGGQSWRALAEGFGSWLYAGGELGRIYHGRRPVDLVVSEPNGSPFALARTPWEVTAEMRFPGSGVELGPADLGLLWTDQDTTSAPDPPGVFFLRARPGSEAALRRDDSITSLEPRPDLAPRFPLAAYDVDLAVPGVTDPDAAVVRDTARPLVLYGLRVPGSGPLLLSKSLNGLVKLTW